MARFTAANAREMAALSVAARKAAEAERTISPAPILLPATPPADTDPYVLERLARVRGQLRGIDRAIEDELNKVGEDGKRIPPDGQRIDRLASAQHRLAEQERILSGRPLPGSLKRKPVLEPRRPSYYDCEPILTVSPISQAPACGVTPAGQPG